MTIELREKDAAGRDEGDLLWVLELGPAEESIVLVRDGDRLAAAFP